MNLEKKLSLKSLKKIIALLTASMLFISCSCDRSAGELDLEDNLLGDAGEFHILFEKNPMMFSLISLEGAENNFSASDYIIFRSSTADCVITSEMDISEVAKDINGEDCANFYSWSGEDHSVGEGGTGENFLETPRYYWVRNEKTREMYHAFIEDSDLFPARKDHAIAFFNDALYVVGGENIHATDDARQFYNDVWRSTDRGKSWEEITANAPFAKRSKFKLEILGNKMYLMGGESFLNTRLGDVWSTEDGVTWSSETTDGFPADKDYASTIFDGKIHVTGGRSTATKEWTSSDGVTWTEVIGASSKFDIKTAHEMFVYNDELYIIGGKIVTEHGIWKRNADSLEWTKILDDTGLEQKSYFGNDYIPYYFQFLGDFSVSVLGDTIYLTGGFAYTENLVTSSNAIDWSVGSAIHQGVKLKNHASVAVESKRLYFIGGNEQGNEVIEFDIDSGQWDKVEQENKLMLTPYISENALE